MPINGYTYRNTVALLERVFIISASANSLDGLHHGAGRPEGRDDVALACEV